VRDKERETERVAVLADIRSRAADRLERLEAEEAKTRQLRYELTALRKGLQDEVGRLREAAETHGLYSQGQIAQLRVRADRLQQLLDSSGGEK
jgi:hypothetical protein